MRRSLLVAIALLVAIGVGLSAWAYLWPRLSLLLRTSTDSPTYAPGTVVRIDLTLTNAGNQVMQLTSPCDFVSVDVLAANGSLISSGRPNCPMVHTLNYSLAPGQSFRFVAYWDERTSQGDPVPSPAAYRIAPHYATVVPTTTVDATIYIA